MNKAGIKVGIIDFAVYENANEYIGVAKVGMPETTSKSFTVNGAGIAGDVVLPVVGHTDAMSVTFEFTDDPEAAAKLSEQRTHDITLMAAHEEFDEVEGRIKVKQHKHHLRVIPIKSGGGSIAPASPQGTSVECACIYREDWIDGKRTLLIDKINNRYIDGSGKDILADVRKALGKN